MEPSEFPGNSEAAKAGAAKKAAPRAQKEKPKVDKIIKSEAVKVKRPFGIRFKEVFFGSDARSATTYITTDVLLPAFRNLVVDAVSKGVERLIYGDNRRRPGMGGYGQGSRTDYRGMGTSRYSGRPGPMLPDQPPLRDRRERTSNDIVLVDKDEAEMVLERLTDMISQFEVASIADLYDLVGLPTNYVDNEWGWTNLSRAGVRQVREGYLIDLPRAEHL